MKPMQFQKTTYTKRVAMFRGGSMAHGSMGDGVNVVYLTNSIRDAKNYPDGSATPPGAKMKTITRTERTPLLGGGFIWEASPTY